MFISNLITIWYLTLEDFYRKAHLVAGGHMTHTRDVICSSVVVSKTVHIFQTMAVLHGQEINEPDILNAYLMALNREKL